MTMEALVVMMVLLASVAAAMGGNVYKVGDSSGWTNIGHVDYKNWASTKTFKVGDTIVFEYNKDFQNVARVNHKNFKECNGDSPFTTYTTGNDSIVIKIPGHYYFICTLPGHCESGQKVDIRVSSSHVSSPPPHSSPAPIEPLPFPYPPPPAPSKSPSPPPSQPLPPVSPSPSPSQPMPPPASPSPSPSVSPSKPLPPPASPSPSPLVSPSKPLPPAASQSPSPSDADDSPLTPAPEIAPSPHKNGATQAFKSNNVWIAMAAVSFYLFAFSS